MLHDSMRRPLIVASAASVGHFSPGRVFNVMSGRNVGRNENSNGSGAASADISLMKPDAYCWLRDRPTLLSLSERCPVSAEASAGADNNGAWASNPLMPSENRGVSLCLRSRTPSISCSGGWTGRYEESTALDFQ